MMKKVLVMMLALCLMVIGVGCGGSDSQDATSSSQTSSAQEPKKDADDEADDEDDDAKTGDTIVIFFSLAGNANLPDGVDASSRASIVKDGDDVEGNAEVIADWIAEAKGCDTYEIETVEKYPADYDETVNQAQEEQNEDARPKLEGDKLDLAKYKNVYLVFPNWWGDMPMALYTFFDEQDFADKNITVCVTHGGSAFSDTIATIKELEPKATVKEGMELSDSDVLDSEKEVKDWAKAN